ncbi:hypothetical protein EVAR_21884_1 [Eumeta japonica]|uniref:Uncharacterized protein n=1 Tax=Eumeta variegata TaxID=151549 RepID=A0A4C1V7F7_EUMVA|nr:hypothetical protein EVAR_21884_1 [Eumeta japonica]
MRQIINTRRARQSVDYGEHKILSLVLALHRYIDTIDVSQCCRCLYILHCCSISLFKRKNRPRIPVRRKICGLPGQFSTRLRRLILSGGKRRRDESSSSPDARYWRVRAADAQTLFQPMYLGRSQFFSSR